jgi:hypothetical protein
MKESLQNLADKLSKNRSLRPGNIVFHLSGDGGGTYVLECGSNEVNVSENVAAGVGRPTLVEVIGDAAAIRAVLDGEVDAREQFLSGGIRVRGDLRYVSDSALELGLLDKPL